MSPIEDLKELLLGNSDNGAYANRTYVAALDALIAERDDARKRIAELEAQYRKLENDYNDMGHLVTSERSAHLETQRALVELWQWCDGWSPAFFYDNEWRATEDRIKPVIDAARAAVAQAEKGGQS